MTHEASALAGTQKLGNLIMIWDDNRISIEDDTRIAHSEDVAARYRAYGWHVEEVDWTAGGEYVEDVDALYQAIRRGKAETERPTFIRLSTIIGWPAPNKQNSGAIHGAAMGEAEVSATKQILGLPDEPFAVEDEVIEHARRVVDRGREARAAWEVEFKAWHESAGERAELFDRLVEGRLPEGWEKAVPSFEPDEKGIATRKASGEFLSAVAPLLPELWGGSADLAGSNNTTPQGRALLPALRPRQ